MLVEDLVHFHDIWTSILASPFPICRLFLSCFWEENANELRGCHQPREGFAILSLWLGSLLVISTAGPSQVSPKLVTMSSWGCQLRLQTETLTGEVISYSLYILPFFISELIEVWMLVIKRNNEFYKVKMTLTKTKDIWSQQRGPQRRRTKRWKIKKKNWKPKRKRKERKGKREEKRRKEMLGMRKSKLALQQNWKQSWCRQKEENLSDSRRPFFLPPIWLNNINTCCQTFLLDGLIANVPLSVPGWTEDHRLMS